MTKLNLYNPFHKIFGEYVFGLDSAEFPKLANLLTKKRLAFWRPIHQGERLSFACSIFTAEEIVLLAEEAGIKLEKLKQSGFPFFIARYRRRYGLLIGFLAGLFLLFYSQLFVWQIEISGNKNIPSSEIERALTNCGISVGSYIPAIDVHRDANILLSKYEAISSAAISINGTHLSVSVLENSPPPEIVNTKGFYNVVAQKDGVILDIDAADGAPEVKEGDVVIKGQLLINSFIEGKNGSFHPTHARGIVYAAVEESFSIEIPLERITKKYTGKSEVKRTYYIFGREIKSLFSPYSSFDYFDAISATKDLTLLGFIKLPMKVTRTTFNEYIPAPSAISVEIAEKYATDAFENFLKDLDCEVISKEHSFYEDKEKGVCLLEANAVVKCDIAKEIPFSIDYYNISERLPNAKE